MKLTCLTVLLLTVLSWGPALAQTSPPDKSRIIGSEVEVRLSWPGRERDYYLEVISSRTPVFSGPVTGNAHILRLRPGNFRWKVSPRVGGGYRDSGQYQSFQILNETDYHFDGKPGQPGAPGRAGGPGGRGESLSVRLRSLGDYVEVTIKATQTRVFLLPQQTQPITITAAGGVGGNGGPGLPGVAGGWSLGYNNQYFYNPPTPGGNGGPGGPGGPGGQIVVDTGGLDPKRYLIVSNPGGRGGLGGAPGLGGESGPNYPPNAGSGYFNNGGYTTGAPNGNPGPTGPDGPPGQVLPAR